MTIDENALTVSWKLPRLLDCSTIEDWIDRLHPTPQSVILGLGSWKQIGPFADSHLQVVLCLLHRNGVHTIATVPPLTFQDDRATAAFSPPHPQQYFRPLTPTERRLAGSIAGLAIGQLCTFNDRHHDIPRLQRKALKKRNYLYGWGSERALAVPVESRITGRPRKPAPVRQSIFHNRLQDLLDPLGISPINSLPSWFEDLKTFAFEASENTWEHGRLDFHSRPIRSIRFVRLRRIDVGSRGFDINTIAPDHSTHFRTYLKALSAAKDLSGLWTPQGGRLVEVTIADGGVGIAARMARAFSVFNRSREHEDKLVLKALLPGYTTKRGGGPGSGQGFRKMLRACYRQSGFMLLRSGRLSYCQTYRRLDGSNEHVDFENLSSRAYILKSDRARHPLVAGTSVSLIFPIPSKRASNRFNH